MSAAPETIEEYCPNCGGWVSYLNFDYQSGWCIDCSGSTDLQPRCTHCGGVLQGSDLYRTTCHICRRELWLRRHADEIEFLMVVKGYSFSQSRTLVIKFVRPICQACGKPIKGASESALFHKRNENSRCHRAYVKFKRLQKSGLTVHEALAKIRS